MGRRPFFDEAKYQQHEQQKNDQKHDDPTRQQGDVHSSSPFGFPSIQCTGARECYGSFLDSLA